MPINHPISEYRAQHGLTAITLAEKLGVTATTVWRWENRKRRIDPNLWQRIHDLTGIPVETLATAQIATPSAPRVEAAE